VYAPRLWWAIEHGCPWFESAVRAAAGGHSEVLRWLDDLAPGMSSESR